MAEVNTGWVAVEVAARLQELGLTVRRRPDGGLSAQIPGDDGRCLHIHVASGTGAVSAATIHRWRQEDTQATQAVRAGGMLPEVVTVLAQDHIGRGLSRRYQAMGLPHVDASGNCWIRLWPMVLHVEGRPRLGMVEASGAETPGGAYTPAGLRLVFVLLTWPGLADESTRALGRAAGISVGSVHNTLSQLAADGYLRRARSTHLLRTRRLTELWLAGYATRLAPKLASKHVAGPEPSWWTPDRLRPSWGVQLGGESALSARGIGLRPGTTLLYGEPPWGGVRAGARLGATTDEGDGFTVQLRQRFWDSDLCPGAPVVPDLLTYADATLSTSSRVHEAAATLWETSTQLRDLGD